MLSGCNPHTRINLHYLPGFVPGSEHVFRPVRVGVPPPAGDFGSGDFEVGAIYSADGNLQARLAVTDLGEVFNHALIKGLADSGLTPVALDSVAADGKLPEGVDYILTSELEELTVNKRFAAQQTIHGQYFTMRAVARVKYQLKDRNGAVLYSDSTTGIENEPPNPVGAEVFLPLETEPGESLSVALSRAIGLLILDPKFSTSLPELPTRDVPLPLPTPPPHP